MKVKQIFMDNFGKFSQFKMEFGDSVTTLVGANGAGKTSVGMTGLWACLKGIAEKNSGGQLIGERFRFIGPNKQSADLQIIVHDSEAGEDVTISNRITKQSNKITCSPVRSDKWLMDLINVAFLSAKHFTALSGKDQALALGIDTAAYDERLKELKAEYTLIGRDIKRIGEPDEVPAVIDKVDVVALTDEKAALLSGYNSEMAKVMAHNTEVTRLTEEKERRERTILSIKAQIADLANTQAMEEVGLEAMSKIEKLLPDATEISTDSIDEKIDNAAAHNEQCTAYEAYVVKMDEIAARKEEMKENKEDQDSLLEERLEYIRGFNMPFKDLAVSEKGELLLKGKPLKEPYFSRGELEIVVSKMYAKTNPKLKFRFIDEAAVFDKAKFVDLVKTLVDDGFQVVVATPEPREYDENVLTLTDCSLEDGRESLG